MSATFSASCLGSFLRIIMPSQMDYLENIPALAPPKGEQSNFDHPRTLASSIIILNAIFVALMFCTVTIRLYTRAFLARALGWDDCKSKIFCFVDSWLTGGSLMSSGSGKCDQTQQQK